jgi:hypothetical protein
MGGALYVSQRRIIKDILENYAATKCLCVLLELQDKKSCNYGNCNSKHTNHHCINELCLCPKVEVSWTFLNVMMIY